MAEKRMLSRTFLTSDSFLDMPHSTQIFYIMLGMAADDDGFVSSPKGVMRQCNVSQADLNTLVEQGYIIPFESGVIVIRHWRVNNNLRSDRHTQTKCMAEWDKLTLDASNAYALAGPGDPPVPMWGSAPDENGKPAGTKERKDKKATSAGRSGHNYNYHDEEGSL